MKPFKDKLGNKLTTKEFFQRWGAGIASINPYQQAKTVYNSTWIIIIGIVGGIIACSFKARTYWWLILILVASLLNTSVQQIANKQKLKALKTVYDAFK